MSFLFHRAVRPIVREPHSSSSIEAVRILALQSGAYLDQRRDPGARFPAGGSFHAGSSVGKATRVRGGSV